MLILSLDTSTFYLGIAITDDKKLLLKRIVYSKEGHSKILIPGIEISLKEAGIDLKQIGLIGISLGPGSFTGLRIGLSTAKGICFAQGIPLKGVSSLKALSYYIDINTYICPLIETVGGVFGALYLREQNELKVEIEDGFFNVDKLMQKVEDKTREEKVFFVGSGSIKYKDLIYQRVKNGRAFINFAHSIPDPYNVAVLALEKYLSEGGDDITGIAPIYLKPPYTEK